MTIQRDDKGPEVIELQNLLNKVGGNLTADGDFGISTEIAVRAFQTEADLTVDAIVGPRTIAALKTYQGSIDAQAHWRLTPYLSQRDNVYTPSGTCNVTSLAMVLGFHGVKAKSGQLEDELFQELNLPEARAVFERDYPSLKKQGFNPRNVTGMLLWLARRRGFKTSFTENATKNKIFEFIGSTGPIFTSGRFTASGHIVCVTGYTGLGDWIVHDPWGDWNKGYRNSQNGKYRIYSKEDMEAILSGNQRDGEKLYRASFISPS